MQVGIFSRFLGWVSANISRYCPFCGRTWISNRHSPLGIVGHLFRFFFFNFYWFFITKCYLVFVTKYKEVYKVKPCYLLFSWPPFLAPDPLPLPAINSWGDVNFQTVFMCA